MKSRSFLPVLFRALNISVILLMVVTQLGWRSVSVVQALPPPAFSAFITENQVHGYNWAAGVSVTMTIDDPDTIPSVDYTDTQTSVVAPWSSSDTWVPFDMAGAFTLEAGQEVTLSGDGTTKTHTVTNLVVTTINVDDDTVAGTAEPGSMVYVGQICDSGGCAWRQVTTDVSGNWLADFSVAGTPPEDTTFDIVPGTQNEAGQSDADGDNTVAYWRVRNPYIQASISDNWVQAWDWEMGTLLTLWVYDPATPEDPDLSVNAIVGHPSWDPNAIVADFPMNDFDVRPGQTLQVTNGTDTDEMIVANVAVTGIDTSADTISGVAGAGRDVQVCVNRPGYCVPRYTTADGSGNWTVNFSIPGTLSDEQETVDLEPGNDGWAAQRDPSSDSTWLNWRVPRPHIQASAQGNWVNAFDWPDGSTVTLTLEDPITPASPDLTVDATVGPAPWNSNEYVAQFDLGGLDVLPGQELEATGGSITRDLTVTGLAITGFDTTLDTITGEGEALLEIEVCVNRPGNCVSRYTAPDGSGDWLVDYQHEGPHDNEKELVDLQPGSDGWAAQRDPDGDETWYDWRVPRPYIQSNPSNNWVQAFDWPDGATVTLTIDDADNGAGVDYTDTGTMGPADWDPNSIRAEFNLGDFDLEAGDTVTITDGTTTRSMLPTNLALTEFDLDADTLTGVGDPALEVQVCVNRPGYCVSRYTDPDGSGDWAVDYAHEGPRDDEKDLVDLQAGNNGWAAQRDSNGNETWLDWNMPRPWIEVNPIFDSVQAREWPEGAELTLTVNDPTNGPGIDQTATASIGPAPWDPNDIVAIFNLSGFDLKPGFILTVTDGTTSRTMTVSNLEITAFDLTADTITGIGRPDEEVEVCANVPGNCYSRYTNPDGSGDWMVDYAHEGPRDNEKDLFDLVAGSDGWMKQTDANGNQTRIDWNILSPWIEASANYNWVHAREWPVGTSLTLTIDDPDSGVGVDFSATDEIGPAPWDPYDMLADFNMSAFDVQSGQTMVVTDGVKSKTLVLTELSVTDFDLDADTITGAATPEVEVQVCANVPNACYTRYVTSDDAGAWTADYGHEGPRGDEKQLVDLMPGSNGWATEYDSDGDRTWFDWRILDPYIEANPGSNWVHGLEWPMAIEVTLTIDDPANGAGVDLTVTDTVGPAPWNSDESWAEFDLGDFDLLPGQLLTMTGGAITRSMVPTNLTITGYNLPADTVTGIGDPNLEVQVCANVPNNCHSRYVMPTAPGVWTVDYAHLGPRNDERQLFNVVSASNGWARQTSADGNDTFADWWVPDPYISRIANQTTSEDTATAAIPFYIDDADVAAADLVLTAESSNTTLVPVSNITFGGSGSNRTITLLPAANQHGIVMITVIVDDGSTQNGITFQLTVTPVDDLPQVALSNKITTLGEDVSTTSATRVANITVTDDEQGTHGLSLSGADASMFQVAGGELRLKAGAVLDFETNPILNVTVAVNDPALGSTPDDSETLVITITNVNEAPVITEGANITVTMTENAKFKAFSLTLHAADVDASTTLTWRIFTAASHGAAVASGTGTSKGITYTPVKDYFGTDSFVVEVSDGKGGVDRITVNVTITKVADVFMPVLFKVTP